VRSVHVCVFEATWKIIWHILVSYLEVQIVLASATHSTHRTAAISHLLELNGLK